MGSRDRPAKETKKKPKDKPKRPLSAYNFFFKEEREKILKVVLAEEPEKVENDPESEDYLGPEQVSKLRKEGGKVSFEEMGKLIGARWKNIDPDRLSKFSELATEDTDRYKKEMASYNGRQEAKMRSEALKPPVGFPQTMKPDGRGYPDGMGFNPSMAQAGYPYAVDFSYGMPMNMYGYSGYAAMGAGAANPEAMARMSGQMQDGSQQQYGANASMYAAQMMQQGGFPSGMMGYG